MNFRLTATLFGVVFAIGLVLLGLSFWGEDAGKDTDLLLTELAGAKADQITTVEIEKGDAKLVLKRSGKDQWALAEPVAARADAAAVNAVVNALLQARPTTYGELSANPTVHGLDKPLRVTLRDDAGKAGTLNVGDVTIGSGSGAAKAVAFVTTPARTRPIAVPRSAVDALLKDSARGNGPAADAARWVGDYRAKSVFAVDTRTGGDDVTEIKLSRGGKDLALSRAGGGWKFDAPAGWGEASATGDPAAAGGAINGVRSLVNAVVNLQAAGSDDFIDAGGDLTQYGLNPGNPEMIRVEIKPKDGPPEVAYIGKKADAPAPKDGTPPPLSGKVYVRAEGTPGVVRATVGAGGVDGLTGVIDNPTVLRDRDLIRDDLKGRVDAIDLTVGGQTVKLRKTGTPGEWKLYGGPNDPQTANQEAVRKLLDVVGQPRVVKDFPAANDAHFAGGELKAEVKLWADAVKPDADPKAEPKVDGPPTVLQFGKKDAGGVYVRRTAATGAKTDFLLPEKVKLGTDLTETDVLAAATKTRLDYLDPSIDRFSQFQATRLAVTQGQVVTVEVVKDKTAAGSFAEPGWKYVKPDAMKDQSADAGVVGDLLNLLATQTVGKFVNENPTRDDLFKYGLLGENPRVKVAVGLDAGLPLAGGAAAAGSEKAYYLGNETDDKQSVYARVEGKPAVFTVPKHVFDRFANPDLRDKTVVRFDPTKVKGVKVVGWKEAVGQVLTREFKREGTTWVAVEPAGYAVDPNKVDEFLKAVQLLRAKEFRAGPEHPDHRLAPDQGGFDVLLTLDGADAVQLTVGTEVDNKASRIVRSSVLANPRRDTLVTLPPDALKTYRENPAAFAK